jgi:tellurite resistance protein TerC
MPLTMLLGLDGMHAGLAASVVADNSPVNLWCWTGFVLLALLLVAIDLLALRRTAHRSPSKSAVTVAVWALIASAFCGVIAWWMGDTAAIQFATGYLLEWSMSMDNVFVFAVIFRYFRVPLVYQYRILLWGILGAIGMRLAFILAGAALIAHFHFVLPLFGFFLIYTGFKMAWQPSGGDDPERNLVLRLARRWLPLADESSGSNSGGVMEVDYGGRFVVRQRGRLRISPPLLVLLVVEGTDLLFAVDSVPAIFGVTRDPFIVFASNVFAILGLRALYFLLADVMDRFSYLHYGLSAMLVFVGLKMVCELWWPDFIPIWVSLAVMAALLGGSILASIVSGKNRKTDVATEKGNHELHD